MFRFKHVAITAFYDYLVGTRIFTVYSCLHISFAGINVCNFVWELTISTLKGRRTIM